MNFSRIIAAVLSLFIVSAAYASQPPKTELRLAIPTSSLVKGKTKIYFVADGSRAPIDSVVLPALKKGSNECVVRHFLNADTTKRIQALYSNLMIYFFNEPGKITANMDNDFCAKGTKLNDAYAAFNESLEKASAPLKDEADKIINNAGLSDKEKQEAIMKLSEKNERITTDAYKTAIAQHPNDALGGVLLLDAFSVLPASEFMAYVNKASNEVRNYPGMDRYITLAGNTLKTDKGQPYTDFKGVDPKNPASALSLSDFIKPGNYTIVDFWASWCGPCRREIRTLKKLYKQYADKNFAIVGAAVWDQLPKTVEAMDQMQVPWPVIYTDPEVQPSVDKTYGIYAIPTLVFIGPDGKIILRSHSSEGIEKILKEQFEK